MKSQPCVFLPNLKHFIVLITKYTEMESRNHKKSKHKKSCFFTLFWPKYPQIMVYYNCCGTCYECAVTCYKENCRSRLTYPVYFLDVILNKQIFYFGLMKNNFWVDEVLLWCGKQGRYYMTSITSVYTCRLPQNLFRNQ